MEDRTLREIWKEEEKKAFLGWDFSYLDKRWIQEDLPWDYKEIVEEYLKEDDKLLDMGTGGGEFLLTLNHPFNKTSVTEMYEPNVLLCKEKLEPLGIEVKRVFLDDDLPFEDNTFDLIINRHESFDIGEVKRILKPNGIFITQQVGGRNNEILSKALIKDFSPMYPDHNLEVVLSKMKDKGFDILYAKEAFPFLRFLDIGAIVYFAKIIEWEFLGFTVDSSFSELKKLNENLKAKGYIESMEHRFVLVALSKK